MLVARAAVLRRLGLTTEAVEPQQEGQRILAAQPPRDRLGSRVPLNALMPAK